MSITLIIIIMTCIVSFTAFNNQKVMDDLIFYPPAVSEKNQWYRFFSCGLIHANIPHLAFNMYSFWLFGQFVEVRFMTIFGPAGKFIYLFMYVTALAVCLLPTYLKNKQNYYYKSLGASGAVSAVIFSFVFLEPTRELGLIFIPVFSLPGFVFGAIYLGVSSYLDKRGGGNINHSAHLWGSLYGIVFLAVTGPLLAGQNLIIHFVDKIKGYLQSF